jgi:hypothetical protein
MNRIVLLFTALLGGFAFLWFAVAEDAAAGPPEGYPREIQLDQVEGVLKSLKIASLGCGLTRWEDKSWGLSTYSFQDKVESPWRKKSVSIQARYANSEKENFLIGIVIDHQEYRREKRTDDRLVWKRDLRNAK